MKFSELINLAPQIIQVSDEWKERNFYPSLKDTEIKSTFYDLHSAVDQQSPQEHFSKMMSRVYSDPNFNKDKNHVLLIEGLNFLPSNTQVELVELLNEMNQTSNIKSVVIINEYKPLVSAASARTYLFTEISLDGTYNSDFPKTNITNIDILREKSESMYGLPMNKSYILGDIHSTDLDKSIGVVITEVLNNQPKSPVSVMTITDGEPTSTKFKDYKNIIPPSLSTVVQLHDKYEDSAKEKIKDDLKIQEITERTQKFLDVSGNAFKTSDNFFQRTLNKIDSIRNKTKPDDSLDKKLKN